jgi:hypothetical protein
MINGHPLPTTLTPPPAGTRLAELPFASLFEIELELNAGGPA